jgi:hypothetical protein
MFLERYDDWIWQDNMTVLLLTENQSQAKQPGKDDSFK